LQETKGHFEQLLQKDQEALGNLGYHIYWNGAQRPGYSGTAALSKIKALSVRYGIDNESFDFNSVEYVDETLLENQE
jgi:exodeoxyribonuclease III